MKQYQQQEANKDEFNTAYESATMNQLGARALNSKRNQPINTGVRSPIVTKGIEHTFGIKNLPSDQIGAIVQNEYMEQAQKL